MRKLIIEIKNYKAVATLSQFMNGRWAIQMSNSYVFDKEAIAQKHGFDQSWIANMKSDVEKIVMFNNIDDVSLVINNRHASISNETSTENINFDINEHVKIKQAEAKEIYFKDIVAVSAKTHEVELFKNKMNVTTTTERIPMAYLQKIRDAFVSHSINLTEILMSHMVIQNAIKPYIKQENVMINLHVDLEDTFITTSINGSIVSTEKIKGGMDRVYANINQEMGISTEKSKAFVRNYGQIPPDSVTDNKLILTQKEESSGFMRTYRKRDLSRYITEIVSDLLDRANKAKNRFESNRVQVVISGDMINIDGIQEYAIKHLDTTDVKLYKTNIFGIADSKSLIATGILKTTNIETKIEENTLKLNREAIKTNKNKSLIVRLKETFNTYYKYN